MAVPSEPRKRPKAPATELPGKGDDTISRYIQSNMRTTKNQAITERPVIERRYEITNEPTKSRCFGLARRQKESKWCPITH